MALTINAPKNRVLTPFFVLLVIVLAPFALFFSLVRIPFAKNRVAKLNEVIAADWLSRKKYVYIGFNDDLPLTEFIEHDIIPKYGGHTIFDKWSVANNEWVASEPDTYYRVTAIWQDIASDFDGDPLLIIAVLTPKQTKLAESTISVYYFNDNESDHATLNGKKISIEDVKKRISTDIRASLNSWKSTAHKPLNFTDDTSPEEIAKRLRGSMPKHIYEAHKHSTNHRTEIEKSKICGCFYCLATFSPDEINEWIQSVNEEFAMCPKCGIDSVIGDASGIAINSKFLREMNKYWFDGDALRG